MKDLIQSLRALERRKCAPGREEENENQPEEGWELVFENVLQALPLCSDWTKEAGRNSRRSWATMLRAPNFCAARSPAKPCT